MRCGSRSIYVDSWSPSATDRTRCHSYEEAFSEGEAPPLRMRVSAAMRSLHHLAVPCAIFRTEVLTQASSIADQPCTYGLRLISVNYAYVRQQNYEPSLDPRLSTPLSLVSLGHPVVTHGHLW